MGSDTCMVKPPNSLAAQWPLEVGNKPDPDKFLHWVLVLFVNQ
ncbi:hypothetical protein VISI1226_20550 [Vibrio sinaloensis DSM 21326]|uniref:Uncharacterized protein n=1 Tax=Vibrio sinaloensis DSM 21326 TaxID=945550 RepID=E8M0Y4_PHOS4|nr:hypothetical protein VISI1226_20550 [Vibrio sinaloensis DSM 21326]